MNGLNYIITEMVCDGCLSLPMHPYLKQSDIKNITDILNDIVL